VSGFGISKPSSLCLKVVLLVILLSNSNLYAANILEYPKAARNSSFTSSSTQKSSRSPENRSATYLKSCELYTDVLPRDGSKRYAIEAPSESLISFFYQVDTEGAELNVEAEGPVNRTQVAVVWLPEPYVYYVSNKSEIRFLVTNPQGDIVNYRFYVDISESLGDSSSKILPLKGGKVVFHVDLRKDDRVLLKLSSENLSKLRIWVFTLYYEILPERAYELRLYRQSLYGTLYFSADLGRRYYIIVDSVEGEGEFSLEKETVSPPWNQEWFWLAVLFTYLITAISLTDIRRTRELEKTTLFALTSYYCWLVTIGLFLSVAGSFSYGTSIYMLLFYLLILSYGLSHSFQIYAAYLDRKITSQNCSNCGKKVNLHEVNYCCGRIVKNVSDAWFLLPLSFGFLFFTISYTIFKEISPAFLSNSLWVASCGSIIGGIIAWWINRNVYAIKLWKQDSKRYYIPSHIPFISIGLLITGILFSFLSPLLIGIFLEAFLTQHIESFFSAHVPWMDIKIASLTLSFYVILGSSVLSIILGSIMVYQIRKILKRDIFEK